MHIHWWFQAIHSRVGTSPALVSCPTPTWRDSSSMIQLSSFHQGQMLSLKALLPDGLCPKYLLLVTFSELILLEDRSTWLTQSAPRCWKEWRNATRTMNQIPSPSASTTSRDSRDSHVESSEHSQFKCLWLTHKCFDCSYMFDGGPANKNHNNQQHYGSRYSSLLSCLRNPKFKPYVNFFYFKQSRTKYQ